MPFENNDQLLCYSKDDVVVYPDSTYNCDKTVDIEENIKEDQVLTLFPNPTSKFLNIKINTKPSFKASVRIFNVSGIEVHSCFITDKETQIDLSFLNRGVYFVQFSNQNTLVSKLIIKE